MTSLLSTLFDTFTVGDIVLGDAYFGTYFLLAELMARNVDAAPETITVCELNVGHKILATTLLSPKTASKHELKDLYMNVVKSKPLKELRLKAVPFGSVPFFLPQFPVSHRLKPKLLSAARLANTNGSPCW